MGNNKIVEAFGIEDTAGFKNLMALINYTKATRLLVRELKEDNDIYIRQIEQFRIELDSMRRTIGQLTTAQYSGGSTA